MRGANLSRLRASADMRNQSMGFIRNISVASTWPTRISKVRNWRTSILSSRSSNWRPFLRSRPFRCGLRRCRSSRRRFHGCQHDRSKIHQRVPWRRNRAVTTVTATGDEIGPGTLACPAPQPNLRPPKSNFSLESSSTTAKAEATGPCSSVPHHLISASTMTASIPDSEAIPITSAVNTADLQNGRTGGAEQRATCVRGYKRSLPHRNGALCYAVCGTAGRCARNCSSCLC